MGCALRLIRVSVCYSLIAVFPVMGSCSSYVVLVWCFGFRMSLGCRVGFDEFAGFSRDGSLFVLLFCAFVYNA